jgi:hypothetical protein
MVKAPHPRTFHQTPGWSQSSISRASPVGMQVVGATSWPTNLTWGDEYHRASTGKEDPCSFVSR